MILKQLVYLVALAREQHFGRAAEACAISQPTLSAAIRQLEEELGITIVERGQRFRGFTPEGRSILDHARRVLSDCDALRQEAGALRGELAGRLRLGVIPTALPVVASLTSLFRDSHPAVAIVVQSLTSVEIQRRIDAFELDGGITYLDFEPLDRVRKVPLYREDYVLLCPDDGRFGRDRISATWREAADLPLCLLTPDMQNRRIVDAMFRSVGCSPRVEVETNAISNLWAHAGVGAWASVVPRLLVSQYGAPPGARALTLTEPHGSQRVGAIIPDRAPASPLSTAFHAAAEKAGMTVLSEHQGRS